jgi:hypothetical protein
MLISVPEFLTSCMECMVAQFSLWKGEEFCCPCGVPALSSLSAIEAGMAGAGAKVAGIESIFGFFGFWS